MRTIILHKTIRFIPLIAAIAVAGCTSANNTENVPLGLQSVAAELGTPVNKAVTRAVDIDDPTLTSLMDRWDEGHVMTVTIDSDTETYGYDNSRFVPVADPVFFSDRSEVDVIFWFGDTSSGVADQDGTAAKLLGADALTATLTTTPVVSVDNLVLIHANSLIDLTFESTVDLTQLSDLTINGIAAYRPPNADNYLAIIEPDEFTVSLTYNGIQGYKITLTAADVPDTQEFAPNYRYTLKLDIDEADNALFVKVIDLAPWADNKTGNAT